MPLLKTDAYTIEDIYALPENERAELIDGQIYSMAPPNRIHQELAGELFYIISNYIKSNHGSCKPFISPFAVTLDKNDKTYVEPDISVICDKNKLTDRGCTGAPDWIIEIVSPSSQRMDYYTKLFKYRTAGVREYWIVNPKNRMVNVYNFEEEDGTAQYSFDDSIQVCIYPDLNITIADFLL